jgi:hypothetical protein
VEPADFIDLMTSTLFAAPIYQSCGRQIAEQRYEGGGILIEAPSSARHRCLSNTSSQDVLIAHRPGNIGD